jgi:hypothetical protein
MHYLDFTPAELAPAENFAEAFQRSGYKIFTSLTWYAVPDGSGSLQP